MRVTSRLQVSRAAGQARRRRPGHCPSLRPAGPRRAARPLARVPTPRWVWPGRRVGEQGRDSWRRGVEMSGAVSAMLPWHRSATQWAPERPGRVPGVGSRIGLWRGQRGGGGGRALKTAASGPSRGARSPSPSSPRLALPSAGPPGGLLARCASATCDGCVAASHPWRCAAEGRADWWEQR